MPLTRSFKDTLRARAAADPAFRQALLQEAVQALLDGDAQTGRAVLRDYINATVGFERLAEMTGTPVKSLMRMFGPRGNPQARHLLAVLDAVQRATGVRLEVRARARPLDQGAIVAASSPASARSATAS
jgi:DNA-binding phage protein